MSSDDSSDPASPIEANASRETRPSGPSDAMLSNLSEANCTTMETISESAAFVCSEREVIANRRDLALLLPTVPLGMREVGKAGEDGAGQRRVVYVAVRLFELEDEDLVPRSLVRPWAPVQGRCRALVALCFSLSRSSWSSSGSSEPHSSLVLEYKNI